MVFYLIGLGLGSPDDITVKGLEIVKRAAAVYLESYTSVLTGGKPALEAFYGREVTLADRDTVEQGCDGMLERAKTDDVALLVVGDPFGATTHTDLVLRAVELGVPYRVVHNASIMNAAGCCGLQLYNFGETVSVVFWTDAWKPESFVDKVERNLARGLHTLCLLDIKVKEQSIENLMKGNKIYEPARFMSAPLAAEQLLEAVERRPQSPLKADTLCVALARVGSPEQAIVAAPLRQFPALELGPPLHSLIVCGELHPLENDFVKQFLAEQS